MIQTHHTHSYYILWKKRSFVFYCGLHVQYEALPFRGFLHLELQYIDLVTAMAATKG